MAGVQADLPSHATTRANPFLETVNDGHEALMKGPAASTSPENQDQVVMAPLPSAVFMGLTLMGDWVSLESERIHHSYRSSCSG
jgi:hypothetical protein